MTPTPAQAKAGNYKKEHVQHDGLLISIENPAGSIRSGVSKDGKTWSTKMQDHYGYLKGVRGADKEHLDIFLSPVAKAGAPVHVIDQCKPADGTFDEHKVMIGYPTKEEATAAYQRNYDPSWIGLGEVTTLPIDEFKKQISGGRFHKPLAMKKGVKMNPVNLQKAKELLKSLNKGGAGSGRYPAGSGTSPDTEGSGARDDTPKTHNGIKESTVQDLSRKVRGGKPIADVVTIGDRTSVIVRVGIDQKENLMHAQDILREDGVKTGTTSKMFSGDIGIPIIKSALGRLGKGGAGSGHYPAGSGASPDEDAQGGLNAERSSPLPSGDASNILGISRLGDGRLNGRELAEKGFQGVPKNGLPKVGSTMDYYNHQGDKVSGKVIVSQPDRITYKHSYGRVDSFKPVNQFTGKALEKMEKSSVKFSKAKMNPVNLAKAAKLLDELNKGGAGSGRYPAGSGKSPDEDATGGGKGGDKPRAGRNEGISNPGSKAKDSKAASKEAAKLKNGDSFLMEQDDGMGKIDVNAYNGTVDISGIGPSGTYSTYARVGASPKEFQRKINTVAVAVGWNSAFRN